MFSLILSTLLTIQPPEVHLSCKDWSARVNLIMRDRRWTLAEKERLINYLRSKVKQSCPKPGLLVMTFPSHLLAR